MNESQKDTARSIAAAKILLDGRDPRVVPSEVLVTLEHLVTLILLCTNRENSTQAAAMLNEGLVPGVESRLALYVSRRP